MAVSLPVCEERACGLMASLLGTPSAPFSQGRRPRATQGSDRSQCGNLQGLLVRRHSASDRPHQEEGRRRISPQPGFSGGWHTSTAYTPQGRTPVSTFSCRIPPAHIRNTLSLAADPPSLGSFKFTPFLPSALSVSTSFLERLSTFFLLAATSY